MPTYEYECLACKHRFERFQKFTDAPVSECPECGSQVRKVLFPAGVVFKGSGWYVTDSRKSGSESTADPLKSPTKADGKGESTSDAKSDTAAKATSDGAKSDSARSDSAKSDSAKSAKSKSSGSTKSESSTPAKA
jgi:putative FmdB family regulatory protein